MHSRCLCTRPMCDLVMWGSTCHYNNILFYLLYMCILSIPQGVTSSLPSLTLSDNLPVPYICTTRTELEGDSEPGVEATSTRTELEGDSESGVEATSTLATIDSTEGIASLGLEEGGGVLDSQFSELEEHSYDVSSVHTDSSGEFFDAHAEPRHKHTSRGHGRGVEEESDDVVEDNEFTVDEDTSSMLLYIFAALSVCFRIEGEIQS